MAIHITFGEQERHCGSCTLCCKLLPVPPLGKPAGRRCAHQRLSKGCTIYARRPRECALWNCVWLGGGEETEGLRRPDRCHYVVDPLPDYVTAVDPNDGRRMNVQVVQVWIDPDYPEAARDPGLLRYLERRAADGVAAILRFSATKGVVAAAPCMSNTKEWLFLDGALTEREHTLDEVIAALE